MNASTDFSKLAAVAAITVAGLFTGCRGGISDKPPVHLVLDMDFQQKLKAQSESTFPGWTDHRGMRQPVNGTIARGGKPAGSRLGEYYMPSTDEVFASFDADRNDQIDRLEAHNLPISHIRTFRLVDRDGSGSLNRGEVTAAASLFRYKNADGSFVTENPVPATEAVLERGRERFNIHCAVCHGQSGRGGVVAARWPVPIPDLMAHDDATTRARLIGLPFGEIFATLTEGKGTMPSYAQQIDVDDRWAIAHYLKALQNHFN